MAGVKEVAIRPVATGGTVEEAVPHHRVEALRLDDGVLGALHARATRCEEVYGPGRDIEWAWADGRLYLLQCRAVTHAAPARPRPVPASAAPSEVIGAVPLFAGLSQAEVERVTGLFKEREFAAGETIIKEGVGAAAFFVILSGEVAVSVHGTPVSTLTRGDYFGEIALIDEGDRSATITAVTDVVCQGLTYWEFRPLVQSSAVIAWNLLQTLAKRLRSAERG